MFEDQNFKLEFFDSKNFEKEAIKWIRPKVNKNFYTLTLHFILKQF